MKVVCSVFLIWGFFHSSLWKLFQLYYTEKLSTYVCIWLKTFLNIVAPHCLCILKERLVSCILLLFSASFNFFQNFIVQKSLYSLDLKLWKVKGLNRIFSLFSKILLKRTISEIHTADASKRPLIPIAMKAISACVRQYTIAWIRCNIRGFIVPWIISA